VCDKIKVNVRLLGGGFGRKSKPDYAIEAALLAKQFPGTPIRVQWTREDDIQFSVVEAELDVVLARPLHADGRAWELLRQERRLDCVIGLRLPAEAAPEEPDVDLDLVAD